MALRATPALRIHVHRPPRTHARQGRERPLRRLWLDPVAWFEARAESGSLRPRPQDARHPGGDTRRRSVRGQLLAPVRDMRSRGRDDRIRGQHIHAPVRGGVLVHPRSTRTRRPWPSCPRAARAIEFAENHFVRERVPEQTRLDLRRVTGSGGRVRGGRGRRGCDSGVAVNHAIASEPEPPQGPFTALACEGGRGSIRLNPQQRGRPKGAHAARTEAGSTLAHLCE